MFFKKKPKAWWEGLDFIPIQDMDIPWMVQRAILSNHRGPAPSLFATHIHGFTDSSREQIQKLLSELEAVPLYTNYEEDEGGFYGLYAWPDGGLRISITEDGSYSGQVVSLRKSVVDLVRSRLKLVSKDAPTRGFAYSVIKRQGEFTTMCLGQIEGELRRRNYIEPVSQSFDFLLKELVDPQPSGRLTLLTGEPGTGKSHFLRGVMAHTDASFLLIPPVMVGALTGPDIIGMLDEVEHKGLPVVLVLEDSDAALIKREAGSMSAVSDLLNLADGIAGELLNIRILATTNARAIDMDRAITRPGRLSQIIHFPLLDPAHAQEVFKDLTKGAAEAVFEQPVSLAEVYQKAHELARGAVETTHVKSIHGRRRISINNGPADSSSGMYL